MRATDGASRTLPLDDGDGYFSIATLLIVTTLLALAIGTFVFIRRLTGALNGPLPAPQLVATAAGLCVWAIVLRRLSANRQVFIWVAVCVMLLFAVGCSYPGNRFVDWLVWLPAIGLITWPRWATHLKWGRPIRRQPLVTDHSATAERVLQQLTRVRLADGKDAIRGTLVAEFKPGERQTTLYVGFCPPFELLPQVEANVVEDFEADIKLAQVLHNGAQLDVRLGEPAEDTIAVTLEFFAAERE